MPAAYVPPWLNVQPSDFVQAASAGGRLGAQLAEMASQSAIARDRNATALQEASMRSSDEAAARQAAGERAAQDRALQQWQIQQQMIHNQSVIDAENQRAANAITGENQRNQNTIAAENQRAAQSLAESNAYHLGMLDKYNLQNQIAQQRADQAADKEKRLETPQVTAHLPGKPGHDVYTINDAGEHRMILPDIQPSSVTTTNVADLANKIGPRFNITTNTIPPTPSLSWKVSPGGDLNPPTAPVKSPLSPLEGKTVRNNATGEIGTITNGAFVPNQPATDNWQDED